MNTIFKTIAAAALVSGFLATSASAASVAPSQQTASQGVVIVPASASPYQEEAAAAKYKRGKVVDYNGQSAPGSIIVNTKQNRLYYVLGDGKALMFRVATAKRGFEWKGTHKVSAKAKWPSWSPPAEMRKRHPELPTFMAGGPDNPLGARALYLGSSIYRIHGTNAPDSIGKAASSGCIRMLNEDVTYLYGLVKLGAQVTVL
ncbi:MAG: L,D-transpeptidase [Alphaproteobacteria bacterium]|nr:L,D-transpeptidase [Alphaproteobacteria bacterium]